MSKKYFNPSIICIFENSSPIPTRIKKRLSKKSRQPLFYVSKNAEHDIRFGYTGNIMISLDPFLSGKTSQYHIQANRKTIVYQVPKMTFFDFVQGKIKSLKEYSALIEELVLQQLEREIDLLTQTPLERYNRVL